MESRVPNKVNRIVGGPSVYTSFTVLEEEKIPTYHNKGYMKRKPILVNRLYLFCVNV